jgi:hypothetical protein
MRELFRQCGYQIEEIKGIPAPFPKALGDNFVSRFLLRVNDLLIGFSRGLFAYQIFVRAQALPTTNNLLRETIGVSNDLRRTELASRSDTLSLHRA